MMQVSGPRKWQEEPSCSSAAVLNLGAFLWPWGLRDGGVDYALHSVICGLVVEEWVRGYIGW